MPSNVITPEGERRLRAELEQLWREERPRVAREVADAAAQGDRSENAEYIYGKRRLREIDRRLRFLAKRLEELVVVEPGGADDGSIRFGAWVRIEDEAGRAVEYQLVGPDEFDVGSGRISVDSPVGRALLGKRAGDDVAVARPRGRTLFTVLEVWYGARR